MKKKIRFCYRKIISSGATKPWDKIVFDESYMEFRMQIQNFEMHRQYPFYGELIHHVPQAKELPARVLPSVSGYITQLDNILPDILNNNGRRFMRFEHFEFEIINSHFELKEKHQIGISFFSDPYFWLDTIGNYLLISGTTVPEKGPVLTETLQLQPYLSIYNIQDYE